MDMVYAVVVIGEYIMFLLFFFQAEDGIRDLVRSRGLGDVYKRQAQPNGFRALEVRAPRRKSPDGVGKPLASAQLPRLAHRVLCDGDGVPVSYTHLTLPTSDLV